MLVIPEFRKPKQKSSIKACQNYKILSQNTDTQTHTHKENQKLRASEIDEPVRFLQSLKHIHSILTTHMLERTNNTLAFSNLHRCPPHTQNTHNTYK